MPSQRHRIIETSRLVKQEIYQNKLQIIFSLDFKLSISKHFIYLICFLKKQDKAKTTADRKLTEMTERVRSILRGRFKEKQGEWRQFARKINVSTHFFYDFEIYDLY